MNHLTGTPLEPRRRPTVARPYARTRKDGPRVERMIDNGNDYNGDLADDLAWSITDEPPSVTENIEAPASALAWGAARETALLAVDHQHLWRDLDRDDAYNYLRRAWRGVWDARAQMGTLVHTVNELWTWDQAVDVVDLVTAAAEREVAPVMSWRGRESLVAQDAMGYIDGLEKFWQDWQPDTVSTEEVVAWTGEHPYIGTRDWVLRLAGSDRLTCVDIKTTAHQETHWYQDAWAAQLHALTFADTIVEYDPDGNEVARHPNFPVDDLAVIHLRGDGDYELIDIPMDRSHFEAFMAMRRLHAWRKVWNAPPIMRRPMATTSPALKPGLIDEDVWL